MEFASPTETSFSWRTTPNEDPRKDAFFSSKQSFYDDAQTPKTQLDGSITPPKASTGLRPSTPPRPSAPSTPPALPSTPSAKLTKKSSWISLAKRSFGNKQAMDQQIGQQPQNSVSPPKSRQIPFRTPLRTPLRAIRAPLLSRKKSPEPQTPPGPPPSARRMESRTPPGTPPRTARKAPLEPKTPPGTPPRLKAKQFADPDTPPRPQHQRPGPETPPRSQHQHQRPDPETRPRPECRLPTKQSPPRMPLKRQTAQRTLQSRDVSSHDTAVSSDSRHLLLSSMGTATEEDEATNAPPQVCSQVARVMRQVVDLEESIQEHQRELFHLVQEYQEAQHVASRLRADAEHARLRVLMYERARVSVDRSLEMAQQLISADELQPAILELMRVLLVEEQNATAWYLLAKCRLKVGDLAEAEEACRLSVGFASSKVGVALLGQILFQQGRLDEAVECYLSALRNS